MADIRTGNKQLIKDLNRSLVIETIRNKGPISRTDISHILNLGLSTVTYIVDDLLNNGLVIETGEADSSGGRRPVLFEFNHKFGYTIGIKIEVNHIIFALTDLNANIVVKHITSFPEGEKAPQVISLITEGIKDLMSLADISFEKLLGIGIAVSGHVNGKTGTVIRSSLLGWTNVDLSKEIEKHFNLPVYVDNDVNAYALAELAKGYGRTHDSFICLSIGEGIGTSIVNEGKLYYGHQGGAGEFGHTIIQVNGYLCHCGQRGCLEMYASNKFLRKEGKLLISQFPDSALRSSSFSFDEVYQAAALFRDPLALELLKRAGEYLGVGLINMINSLNPETIVLVGEGMIAQEFFLPYAIETANRNFFAKGGYETTFYVSELGNDAWLMGAALLAIKHLFEPPIYKDSKAKSISL